MDPADTPQELRFFADGDRLLKTSEWQVDSPERADRRRRVLALVLTPLIMVLAATIGMLLLPS